MNNYKTFWLLSLVFFCINVEGQSLLQDGTEWYYNMTGFSTYTVKSNNFRIEGDTTILNRDCKILIREEESCDIRPTNEYLYEDDNRIYFYDSDYSKFKLLYDWNLEVGDVQLFESWNGMNSLGDSTYLMTVDSVNFIELNNRIFKRFVVTFSEGNFGNGPVWDNQVIIEQLGNTNNYFHFNDTGWCDWQYIKGLRCFNSIETDTIKFQDIDCNVSYWGGPSSNKNLSKEAKYINIYPNPSVGKFTIETEIASNLKVINIYTTDGERIKSIDVVNFQNLIDLSEFSDGMFLVQLNYNDDIHYRKIVKY